MMKERLRDVLVFVGLLAFAIILTGFYQPLHAQVVGMATLSGVVTDPSGAGIPGAHVALVSASEQARRETVTEVSGAYLIPTILPGTYRLEVGAQGFGKKVITDVVLASGQGSTLNVTMQIGATATAITVANVAPLLETTTATLGAEVTSTDFNELPMGGRNYTELLLDLPGVSPIPPPDSRNLSVQSYGQQPSIYGQRQRSNEFMLDGTPNMEAIFNGNPIYPPPEAIEEMKVESGMTAGAAGWAAGADINVVTKSGTRDLHGDAWEYLQNTVLNARSFFTPKVTPFRYNQFGGTLGGPLVIPHVLSKAKGWYLFGYYEGIRVHSNASSTAFVPTAAQLDGNFSQSGEPTIYNPYTSVLNSSGALVSRTPFAGNIIPTGPTTVCAPNPTCVDAVTQTLYQSVMPLPNFPVGVIPNVNYLALTPAVIDSDQFSVRADHQFGVRDTFSGRYSYSKNTSYSNGLPNFATGIRTGPLQNISGIYTHTFSPTMVATARFGYDYVNILSLFPINAGLLDSMPAKLGITGTYPGVDGGQPLIPGITITGFNGMSIGPHYYGPQHILTWMGDLQKVHGRHTLEFGGLVTRTEFYTASPGLDSTSFTSTPTAAASGAAGFAFASYMLGLVSGASREMGYEAAQLAGNVYSLYGEDTFRMTRKLTWIAGLRWDYAGSFFDSLGSGTINFLNPQFPYYWNITNPVTGAGANIRPGMIQPDRRGFQPRLGIAYQINPKTVVRASFAVFDDTFGVGYAQSLQGDRGSWPFAISQQEPAANTGLPNTYFENAFVNPKQTTVPDECPQCLNVDKNSSRTGYVLQRTISLQRQITPSLGLEAAYVGSLGVKLSGQVIMNDGMVPGTTPVSTRQADPNYPSNSIVNGYNEYMSWYNGGSLSLKKRFSHNLTGSLNYTYSKTMDTADSLEDGNVDGAPGLRANYYDVGDEKGIPPFGIANLISSTYAYQIPGHFQNKALNGVAGGWWLSGIIGYDSGVPTDVALGTDNENIGGTAAFEYPNLVCNPMSGGGFTVFRGFNTSCFQRPTFGTRGNAGRHAFVPYDSHMWTWNPSIYKEFPFGEGRHVEFRAEAFNAPNAHAFNAGNTTLGASTFGQITGTRQSGRTIQFALKIHF